MDEVNNLNREIRAWNSSHPVSLLNKARWSWWMAFAPVALVGLVYFVATVLLPNWFTGIRSLPTWLYWTIVVIAAAVSAALTQTINCTLGVRQANSNQRSESFSDYSSSVWKQIDGKWLVAALILAAIVPGWLATSAGLSYRRRVAIQLLALAPMLILLVWSTPARGKRNTLVTRWINTGMWAIEILISLSGMVLLTHPDSRFFQFVRTQIPVPMDQLCLAWLCPTGFVVLRSIGSVSPAGNHVKNPAATYVRLAGC